MNLTLREQIEEWENGLKNIPIHRSVFYKSKSNNYKRYRGNRPGNYFKQDNRKRKIVYHDSE